jgi:hypothetical protein
LAQAITPFIRTGRGTRYVERGNPKNV